jgi:hypothetical protein
MGWASAATNSLTRDQLTIHELMTPLYPAQAEALAPCLRKPARITITVNWALRQKLQDRADYEGRSLSNLVSYLLEVGS